MYNKDVYYEDFEKVIVAGEFIKDREDVALGIKDGKLYVICDFENYYHLQVSIDVNEALNAILDYIVAKEA